jgi:hypothetical protein
MHASGKSCSSGGGCASHEYNLEMPFAKARLANAATVHTPSKARLELSMLTAPLPSFIEEPISLKEFLIREGSVYVFACVHFKSSNCVPSARIA